MGLATSFPTAIEIFDQPIISTVDQAITPQQRGRIKFMATYWFARFYDPCCQRSALPGTTVVVVGRTGITLLVIANRT